MLAANRKVYISTLPSFIKLECLARYDLVFSLLLTDLDSPDFFEPRRTTQAAFGSLLERDVSEPGVSLLNGVTLFCVK